MTRKWASCSASGSLSFSRDLLRARPRFREAVIVHELLHLRVPNHGKLFRSLMNAHLPGSEALLKHSARTCR
jgi:predicted metal-dependent hydrolase